MQIRALLNQLPFVVPAYRRINAMIHAPATARELARLEAVPGREAAAIAAALRSLRQRPPQDEQGWIDRIEAERKRFLACDAPLADGSLGEGGLYDKGETISKACLGSKRAKPALFLLKLARGLKPGCVIELGTNLGISSAYLSAALALNGEEGRITTLDASPYRQRAAKQAHGNLGLPNVSYVTGLFSDTLDPVLAHCGPVDLAFIDGHHQYQPTLDYFEKILKASAPNAVFVFDDIRWSRGMERAWEEIRHDERLGLLVDIFNVGIGVRGVGGNREHFMVGPIHAL